MKQKIIPYNVLLSHHLKEDTSIFFLDIDLTLVEVKKIGPQIE